MNGRLQLIEQKLIAIDSAAFQNLCDIYFALKEQEFISYNRTGSKHGKQKTVQGTPDSFFRLTNGNMIFVEATTQESDIVAKIVEDIDKCLDPSKTGIPVTDVQKIVICFNLRLPPKQEIDIFSIAQAKSVAIELFSIDRLAQDIFFRFPILQKDPLGIPVETGQLLPISNFIEEYNNKAGKLSTPLDNEFFHRKNELSEIKSVLSKKDIIILSGFPGVGKTKTALEALQEFLNEHPDYFSYALSKKDVDISEDLRIYLQYDKNYIIFIDDANRQIINFKQVLGIFKEVRKGTIKLLITVRDYAYSDVLAECLEYDLHKITLKKFSDEEILEIIKSDFFNIRNPKYQRRIIELADGNARLAIMGARLANLKQQEFLFGDTSDLYDSYFHTFIKDTDIFSNITKLKTLGLIAFFFSIDRNNREFVNLLLLNFGIDYHDFHEAISDLETDELIEVQFDNIRVSEQVMATYFFYKVFIKDELLPFRILLDNYFFLWKKRFTDTIIPSNNSFGYNNVFSKIDNALFEFFTSIKNDEDKAYEFFSVFWFYKREALLGYFYERIKQLPEPEIPIYGTKYETNDYVWPQDKTLNFITNLFNHYTESFIPAIELAYEYCRKKPESLPELVRRIRENLLFDESDEHIGFIRQVEFLNLIISKTKENKIHYWESFFALSTTFLKHYFEITKGGRKHTITFYHYPLPFYEVTKNLRENIWITLFELYNEYPKKVFDVIKSFRPGFRESISEILEYDLSLLLPFIEDKFDPSDFSHIHFVHDFVFWLDRENISDRSYQNLKTKFYSKEYDYYKKLDWNSLKGKQDFEFANFQDFDKLKEQDLRNSFIFKSPDDFNIFNNTISLSLSLDINIEWSIIKSIDIIIEENFSKNEELGFKLLESVFNNYPHGLQDLYRTIKVITNKSALAAEKLWRLLKSWNNGYALYWKLSFFGYLPDSLVDEFYKNELINTIISINRPCTLFFESFQKFVKLDKDILHFILSSTVEKIESLNFRISYSFHFFEKFSDYFSDKIELLSKAYMQQIKFDAHFDFDSKGLEKIIYLKHDFLIEYITRFYTDNQYGQRNTERYIPFVWNIENFEPIIERVVNLIIEHNPYFGLGDYSLNILFNRISDIQKQKVKKFLLSYIIKYKDCTEKMNAIFNAIRKNLHDFFEDAFIYYLTINTDIGAFKKIQWIGNGIYKGEAIIGEIHAKRWDELFRMVEKCKNQLDLILIRNYIKQQIESEMKSAEWERKRKFSDPYFS